MLLGWPQHAGQAAGAAPDPAVVRMASSIDLHAEIRASPVAEGDTLYVAAENGNLYALDLATRRTRWLYHAGRCIGSTPAVADGKVFVLSRDGRLHAVDAASGAPLWSFRTQGEAVFSAI